MSAPLTQPSESKDAVVRASRGPSDPIAQKLRIRATRGYDAAKSFSKVAEERLRRAARHMKADRPIQTIAAIAGGAFLLGLLIRIKRTHSS